MASLPANIGAECMRAAGYQKLPFDLPCTLKLEGTVINDAKGQKIGELQPGFITLDTYITPEEFAGRLIAGGPALISVNDYEIRFSEPSPRSSLETKSAVSVGAKHYVYIKRKVIYECCPRDGIWYSHTFVTGHKDRHLFAITFYTFPNQSVPMSMYMSVLGSIVWP